MYLLLFLACLPALDMESPAVARRVLEAISETGASDAERKTLTTIIQKGVRGRPPRLGGHDDHHGMEV